MSWEYKWANHRFHDTSIPEQAHYTIVLFTNRTYYNARHDRYYQYDQDIVRCFEYYVFADKGQWEKAISEYYDPQNSRFVRPDDNFVFFKSSGRGKVKMTIDVQVDIDDKEL